MLGLYKAASWDTRIALGSQCTDLKVVVVYYLIRNI